MLSEQYLQDLILRSQHLIAIEVLQLVNDEFGPEATFSTSFGIEDQVVTHLLSGLQNLRIDVFTLDTGRLFPETQNLWSRTLEHFRIPIRSFYPDPESLNDYVLKNGNNAFYQSIDFRKQCCEIRKVVPLNKALAGKKIWITGIRAEQSVGRNEMKRLEWDAERKLIKFHPILEWSWENLVLYAEEHKIPVNPLHRKGFASIGCAPCTRAVQPGADFRSGRWWWENNKDKECGLHTHQIDDHKIEINIGHDRT